MIELEHMTQEEFESLKKRYDELEDMTPCCAYRQAVFIEKAHEAWKSGVIVGAIFGVCVGILLGILAGGVA